MKYQELKSQNQELKNLEKKLDDLIATTGAKLDAEAQAVDQEIENLRLRYLLNSHARSPEEVEELRVNWQSAIAHKEKTELNYDKAESDIRFEILTIEERLKEESEDENNEAVYDREFQQTIKENETSEGEEAGKEDEDE